MLACVEIEILELGGLAQPTRHTFHQEVISFPHNTNWCVDSAECLIISIRLHACIISNHKGSAPVGIVVVVWIFYLKPILNSTQLMALQAHKPTNAYPLESTQIWFSLRTLGQQWSKYIIMQFWPQSFSECRPNCALDTLAKEIRVGLSLKWGRRMWVTKSP